MFSLTLNHDLATERAGSSVWYERLTCTQKVACPDRAWVPQTILTAFAFIRGMQGHGVWGDRGLRQGS